MVSIGMLDRRFWNHLLFSGYRESMVLVCIEYYDLSYYQWFDYLDHARNVYSLPSDGFKKCFQDSNRHVIGLNDFNGSCYEYCRRDSNWRCHADLVGDSIYVNGWLYYSTAIQLFPTKKIRQSLPLTYLTESLIFQFLAQ